MTFQTKIAYVTRHRLHANSYACYGAFFADRISRRHIGQAQCVGFKAKQNSNWTTYIFNFFLLNVLPISAAQITEMEITWFKVIWLHLAVLRFMLCILPQTGYIFPDEFFQSPEIAAGEPNVHLTNKWFPW